MQDRAKVRAGGPSSRPRTQSALVLENGVRSSLSNSGSLANTPNAQLARRVQSPGRRQPTWVFLFPSQPVRSCGPRGSRQAYVRTPTSPRPCQHRGAVHLAAAAHKRSIRTLTDVSRPRATPRDTSPQVNFPGVSPAVQRTDSIDRPQPYADSARAVAESANAVQGGCMAKTHSDLETLFPFTGKPASSSPSTCAPARRASTSPAPGVERTLLRNRESCDRRPRRCRLVVATDWGAYVFNLDAPHSRIALDAVRAATGYEYRTSREPGPIRPGGTAVPRTSRSATPYSCAACPRRYSDAGRPSPAPLSTYRPVSAGARSFVLGIERVVGSASC